MPPASQLLLFMAATLALNLTPGPDMLYVIGRSVGEGRRAGVISALGISSGTLVHTVVVVVGLGQLLAGTPTALGTVRFAGAAWLMLLGVRMLRSADHDSSEPVFRQAPAATVFWQGVLTNMFNPKVALFFLAFLPQFVDPGRGAVRWQLAVLALLFNTSGTLVNIGVALLAGSIGAWMRAREGVGRSLRRVTGALLFGLGVRLVVFD